MRLLFCVFSGTGNTRYACERLAAKLQALGHETDTVAIRSDVPMPEIEGYDLLIVGYPVHAFNAPTSVLSFLKKLPEGKGMGAYLVRSSGEPSKLNDASGVTPARILKRKGYEVRGEFVYVMPYNIIFRHSDGMAARMAHALELRTDRDAVTLSEGKGERRKVNAVRRATAFVLRIEHPAMPLIGKTFHVNKKLCVGCGKCAKVCPCGNITMKDGHPKFGMHCVGCMGCSFSCPQDALRISVLNLWRVNGAYSYDAPPASDDEVCRYLHGMYVRYFHESEEIR